MSNGLLSLCFACIVRRADTFVVPFAATTIRSIGSRPMHLQNEINESSIRVTTNCSGMDAECLPFCHDHASHVRCLLAFLVAKVRRSNLDPCRISTRLCHRPDSNSTYPMAVVYHKAAAKQIPIRNEIKGVTRHSQWHT